MVQYTTKEVLKVKTITQEIIENFKTHLIGEEKAENTTQKYVRDVTAFAKWLGERELNKNTVLEYKTKLISRYTSAGVNSRLSSLNSFFAFCGLRDCKIKSVKIQKQIFAQTEKELTKAEYERLLRTAKRRKDRRLNYLMQTICSTGIRVSELKHITVEAVKRGQATINSKGKTRVVVLPKQLCKMLMGYVKEQKIESGAVFVTRTGRPLDRHAIWKAMKALCESAGVDRKKVFPHNLRHLFARTFYSLEKDIVRLADILGHSSVNTTRIYTMETCEVHRRQIQRLGLLRC